MALQDAEGRIVRGTAASPDMSPPNLNSSNTGRESPVKPQSRPGVVAAAVYEHGQRILDIEIKDAHSWKGRDKAVVWIGLHEPDEALLREVQAEFGLHELAIEDAGHAHQRPKLEIYGDAIFVVARTAHMMGEEIVFGETHLFVGRGYVVSVRHGPSTSYNLVRQRCEASPAALAHGENYILYSILDFIVDNYMPVVEGIHAEVEELEERVLRERLNKKDIERLYFLRRSLLRLRNAVVPLVDVCRRHEHLDLPGMDATLHALFRDVTDHVRRVQEDIDTLREVLAFTFEASLMIRGQLDDRPIRANGNFAQARLLGGNPRGSDSDCRDLRDEFRRHAGTEVQIRLFRRPGFDLRRLQHALPDVPAGEMALRQKAIRSGAAPSGWHGHPCR